MSFFKAGVEARQEDPVSNGLHTSTVPKTPNDSQVPTPNAHVSESARGLVPFRVIPWEPGFYDPGVATDNLRR